MTLPLTAFGMIGDGETAALVSDQGSIDWLCLPRFDSPACCAALLGTPEHGCWSIAPVQPVVVRCQQYEIDTLILQTELSTAEGSVRLTDFMPIRKSDPVVVRIVTGLTGRVAMRFSAAFRFDYGHMPPWLTRTADGVRLQVGPDEVRLHGVAGAEVDNDVVRHEFEIAPDEQRSFILSYRGFGEHDGSDELPDVADLLDETRRYWRDWIGRCEVRTEHDEALRRSLLTLKGLIHRPTGGLVAAATTSLPEQPGGKLNWDYRYCWLRDASFTLTALLGCGFQQEARAWRDWMLRAIAGAPDRMQIVYRVDGSRRLDEVELDWLPGYRFAKPVRIGNQAAGQFQLDVYGELLNVLFLCRRAGLPGSAQERHLQHTIAQHVSKVWTQPDQGLWEARGEPRHYTYSKVMAWVALDRFLQGDAVDELPAEQREWLHRLTRHIHDVVCREGFSEGLGSFTSYFGGEEVDASLLLLSKFGFLPVDDERMAGTIAAIERELLDDGLVRRSRSSKQVPQGAFLACSCWLAECMLMQGRRADAQGLIERMLQVAGPTGLLSEEYDRAAKRLCGNYPQALSHVALINVLLALRQD